jgi:hypothetical protein
VKKLVDGEKHKMCLLVINDLRKPILAVFNFFTASDALRIASFSFCNPARNGVKSSYERDRIESTRCGCVRRADASRAHPRA